MHCVIGLQELSRRDIDYYKNIVGSINPGILINFQETTKFWKSYNNPLEPVIKGVYNNFLKANNQEKGIESYGYVVAMIVNYLQIK